MLEFETAKMGAQLVLKTRGRMDNKTASEFNDKIERIIEVGEKHIVVDLSRLEYISSAGLRAILTAGMRMRAVEGALVFCCMTGMVKEVLDVAGFDAMFPTFPTLNEALQGASSSPAASQ